MMNTQSLFLQKHMPEGKLQQNELPGQRSASTE